MHFIWQVMHGYNLDDVHTSFKKYTSMQFTKLLLEDNNIAHYEVASNDRKHHFWQRNSLGVELFTESVFLKNCITYIKML